MVIFAYLYSELSFLIKHSIEKKPKMIISDIKEMSILEVHL